MIPWADFHFLRPVWLLLLPVALLVFLKYRGQARVKTSWERVVDPHLLPHLMRERTPALRSRKEPLLLFAFLLLTIVSLAGPTLKKIPNDVAYYQAPLVVCFEVSPHMLAKDIQPSRIKRAQFKLEDLLRQYVGAEVALIAFAGDAHLVVPLSNDHNTILTMAKNLSPDMMPIKGVNLGSALTLAKDITKKNARARVVVITSTNIDDAQSLQPFAGSAVLWAFATDAGGPMELANGRFDQGRGGAVAISKLRRDVLDVLKSHSSMTTLMASADQSDVDTIVRGLQGGTPVESERDVFFDQWYDLGPYVLIAAMLVLLGIFFTREHALLLCLLVLLPASQGKASILDWFLRRDQQAQQALDEKQPQKAAELFDDDFRKGTSYYRAHDYDKAIAHLQAVNTSDGQFNLGNAYAQKGQYQEAIDAYKRALALDPKNQDATANKELLEKQQQQKQQEQSDKGKESEKDPNQDSKPSEEKNEQQKQDQQQQQDPSSSGTKQDQEATQQGQDKKQEDRPKSQEGQGQNPESKPGHAQKTGEQPKEAPQGEKLDPETLYYFQRLEQNNNQFLKRKFLYESQKRQVAP